MSRFRCVVFDWDGTLADSTSVIARSLQGACEDMGFARPSDATAKYVIGLGLRETLQLVAPSMVESQYPAMADAYRKRFLVEEPNVDLFDGARAMLDELNTPERLLCVATGKSRRGLDRNLERHGLHNHFAATRCADEGRPKPHPDMLLWLMDRLGVEPNETLMIGDTTHDLGLAQNAGVASVAVSYGAHEDSAFKDFAPIGVVHSVAELHSLLRSVT